LRQAAGRIAAPAAVRRTLTENLAAVDIAAREFLLRIFPFLSNELRRLADTAIEAMAAS
jgi:hypothetical protein